MDTRYKYGHRPGRRRRTRVLIVLAVSFVILGIVGGVVGYDTYKNQSKPVEGIKHTISQSLDETVNKYNVGEPTFSMELPGDWKETGRKNDALNQSISWRATQKNADNRYLEVFIDKIPTTKAINRLLPVSATDNVLIHGDISDNCASFTQGGTFNTGQADKLKETPAKYQTIDFICNLPRVTENEVGTGSIEGGNTVTVSGEIKGAHKYFFLYTDHNIQPDYTILYNAIKSFKAK